VGKSCLKGERSSIRSKRLPGAIPLATTDFNFLLFSVSAMAMDRLAALRVFHSFLSFSHLRAHLLSKAQRQQDPAQNTYELNSTQQATNYTSNQSSSSGNNAGNGASDSFYDEVFHTVVSLPHDVAPLTKNASIQVSNVQGLINQFSNDVTRISELQGRSLNAVDGTSQDLALLDDQVAQTRDLGNQIKRRIEALKKQPVPRGQEARKNQACHLHARTVH
jgi:hypothetical protein